jgi:hypothetical protein
MTAGAFIPASVLGKGGQLGGDSGEKSAENVSKGDNAHRHLLFCLGRHGSGVFDCNGVHIMVL